MKIKPGITMGYVFDLDKSAQNDLSKINGLNYGYYLSNLFYSTSDSDIEVRFNLNDEKTFNQLEIKEKVEKLASDYDLKIKFSNMCLMGEQFQIATSKELLKEVYAKMLLEELVKTIDGTAPPAPIIEVGKFAL